VSFYITPGEDADQHHQQMLERIARLCKLEVLSLDNDDIQPNEMALDLRLEKGLGQLSTLKRLKSLALFSCDQRLNVADVEVHSSHPLI